ncbi:MAG: serine/threonine-protein kinase, partial [Labedaea sp.]
MGAEQLIAGRYRLVRQVGSGGMGVVWQAYDERLHRKVAVKQLLMPAELTGPQTAQARRLAMREGRIAAKLQHPQAIAVYDVLDDDGQSYLIMEYLPSTSLAQVLAERGPLPPREVAAIGAQLADALAAAHAAGVVHRDVKPGNVLLGPDGTVKITDFGISRAVEDVTATATGLIAGTPAYLSPEVAQGQPATYQSDVFSLGATLYAAVEGKPPAGTADNAMAVLYRAASGDLDPPTRAGPITDLLVEMLSPGPARRPSMAAVRDRLERIADPPAEPPPAPVAPAVPAEPVAPAVPREPVAPAVP